jgi:Ca2+-binding EF-hand superfamily protein
MKPPISLGLLAAALMITMHAAQAESFRDRQIDERFAAADKNNDGKLTLDEARQGMPRVADHFDKIDSQQRGYVTLEQIKAAADQ